jgi:hypothetical protein
LRVPFFAGAALFCICLVLGRLSLAQSSPLAILVLQALLGGAVYAAAVLILDPTLRRFVRLPTPSRDHVGGPALGTEGSAGDWLRPGGRAQ